MKLYVVEPLKNINFGATGVDEVLQNVAFILATSLMSCPLDREFGWDSNIDKPIDIAKLMVMAQITEAITNFEPRAEIVSIEVSSDAMKGKLIPKVKVKINESI